MFYPRIYIPASHFQPNIQHSILLNSFPRGKQIFLLSFLTWKKTVYPDVSLKFSQSNVVGACQISHKIASTASLNKLPTSTSDYQQVKMSRQTCFSDQASARRERPVSLSGAARSWRASCLRPSRRVTSWGSRRSSSSWGPGSAARRTGQSAAPHRDRDSRVR